MNRALLTLLVSLWKLILFLPRPLHKVFILTLGNLIYLMPIKRNKISKKNIDLCFPNMPLKQRNNLLKANIVASAQIVFDFQKSPHQGFFQFHHRLKFVLNLLSE